MFYIRIERAAPGRLDLVQIANDTRQFLLEIEGRRVAIGWLLRQGCCPRASRMLYGLAFGKVYNIDSPVEPPGTGVSLPEPEPPFFQDPPGSPSG